MGIVGCITAVAVALGLLLRIIVWWGDYKRKDEAQRRAIYAEMKHLEQELAKSLSHNDMVNVTRISHRLRELREEYKHYKVKK